MPIVDRIKGWFGFAEAPAPPKQQDQPPDRAALVSASSVGLEQKRSAFTAGQQNQAALLSAFLSDGNPAADMQDIYSKRSEASAQGFWHLNDGRFYDLLDEMPRKAPVLATGLNQLESLVLRRDITLRVDNPDDPASAEILAAAEEAWNPHLRKMVTLFLTPTIRHGRSTIEVMWKEGEGGRIDPERLLHCHPGIFVYDSLGNQYLYGKTGPDGGPQPVPAYKFASCTREGLYANPYGQSVLFDLQYCYQFAKDAQRSTVEYLDRTAQPFLVGKLPAGMAEKEFLVARENLRQAMAGLTTDFGLILRGDVNIEVHPRNGGNSGDPPHLALYNQMVREMLTHLIGSTLGIMESQFGTRAQAEVHSGTSESYTKPVAHLAAEACNVPLDYWRVINYGPDAPKVYVDIDLSDPMDLVQAAAWIEKLVNMGAKVPQSIAQEWYGLPVAEEGEELLKAPATPAPAIPGAAPFGADGKPPEQDPPDPDDDPEDDGPGDPELFAEENMRPLRLAKERGFRDRREKAAREGFAAAKPALLKQYREQLKSVSGPDDVKLSIELPEDSLRAIETASILGAMISDSNFAPVLKERSAKAFAEYQGREVRLNKPFRTPGESRKFAVYVQNDRGNVVKVRFGDPNAEIRRDDAGARANFRARHQCDTRKWPKTSAAYWSCRMWDDDFSVSDVLKASEQFAELPDDVEVDERFRPALEWALERGVLTREEVRQAADVLARQEASILDARQWEQQIRRQKIALARTVSDTATAAVRDELARTLNSGGTLADWFETVDKNLADGFLPGTGDGYYENVFRTETANAYRAQREEWESAPEIQDVLWGWQIMNPDDNRSRSSHAALNGVYLKNGGEAYAYLGLPPWSYQCRCVAVPVILADPSAPPPEIEEPANIMDLARAVEKFGEGDGHPHCC